MPSTKLLALSEQYKSLLDMLPSDSDDASNYDLILLMAAKLKCSRLLNEIFAGSPNKLETQKYLDNTIKVAHDNSFGLTQHGIRKTLEGTYSDATLNQIGQALQHVIDELKSNIGVETFITSGTLLGIVRSGKVIPHDDDFDMAYISRHSDRTDILRERREIARFLASHPDFQGKAREKHFGLHYNSNGLRFYCDLFPAWLERDRAFTEVPLKPSGIQGSDILPLKKVDFYGVKLPAPANPEAFLEMNYGPNWREPDPSFRFDFGQYAENYWFLHEDFISDDFPK